MIRHEALTELDLWRLYKTNDKSIIMIRHLLKILSLIFARDSGDLAACVDCSLNLSQNGC